MRWRDLEHGVWLSLDPIGFGDGPNMYCYVHCNPITHFDAWGLADVYIVPARAYVKKSFYNKQQGKTVHYKHEVTRMSESIARQRAFALQKENPENVHVIEATGWKDAKSQLVDYQGGDGNTIDTLHIEGEGNDDGQFLGAADGRASDKQLKAENLEEFYSGIQIEENGYVEYGGCEVAKGENGDAYISSSAKQVNRRAIGYATKHGTKLSYLRGYVDYGMDPDQSKSWKRTLPGPAQKYQKYADPGGPVLPVLDDEGNDKEDEQ